MMWCWKLARWCDDTVEQLDKTTDDSMTQECNIVTYLYQITHQTHVDGLAIILSIPLCEYMAQCRCLALLCPAGSVPSHTVVDREPYKNRDIYCSVLCFCKAHCESGRKRLNLLLGL